MRRAQQLVWKPRSPRIAHSTFKIEHDGLSLPDKHLGGEKPVFLRGEGKYKACSAAMI